MSREIGPGSETHHCVLHRVRGKSYFAWGCFSIFRVLTPAGVYFCFGIRSFSFSMSLMFIFMPPGITMSPGF